MKHGILCSRKLRHDRPTLVLLICRPRRTRDNSISWLDEEETNSKKDVRKMEAVMLRNGTLR